MTDGGAAAEAVWIWNGIACLFGPKECTAEGAEVFRNLLWGLGAPAAVIGLLISIWRARTDSARLVSENYVKAVELLGHEKRAVRLGAIYSLEGILRITPYLRGQVVNTLCAYVRERSRLENKAIAEMRSKVVSDVPCGQIFPKIGREYFEESRVSEDVAAAFVVVGRLPKETFEENIPDFFVFIREKPFIFVCGLYFVFFLFFKGYGFEISSIQNLFLEAQWLIAAIAFFIFFFSVRIRTRTRDLRGARLLRLQVFEKIDLSGALLDNADLKEVKLNGIDLSKSQLVGADMTGSFLCEANLSGANLENANVKDVCLCKSKISKSALKSAKSFDTVRL